MVVKLGFSDRLREGHRLRMFMNSVPKRVFGSKMQEITGGCRRLHDEKFVFFMNYC
jgi:hypothetical protein